jgi:small redox-active disulfide protein 2
MVIKVLGTGCANCRALEIHARKAVAELDAGAKIVKVDDIVQILEYKVLRTPALVIDEQVVLQGKVASVAEIKTLIRHNIKS